MDFKSCIKRCKYILQDYFGKITGIKCLKMGQSAKSEWE